jgi:hypothetical protein
MAPPMAAPFTYDSFTVDPAPGRLTCTYALGGRRFREEVTLGTGGDWSAPAATAAARLLFLLAGVSYYKTAAPPLVDLGGLPTTAAEREFLTAFYRHGLAEFAHRNGLDLSGLAITGPDAPAPAGDGPAARAAPPERPLVPFGGGIDSIVVAETVRARHEDTTLFVVNRPGDRFAAIEPAAAVSGLPVRHAERAIDPQLMEKDNGFLNGHVPVTGILSAVAVLCAAVFGHDAVVMANERSASEPTLLADGVAVNHQWSKGAVFETAFRAVLAAADIGVDYYSLLRPYSELWVAQRFADLPGYWPVFRSCNRAFALDPARRAERWCGRCDKCCFIDLVLAPFLPAAVLREVFDGAEPLEDPTLLDQFTALVGGGGEPRPFECVGDVTECRAALARAAARPDRAGNPVLAALAATVAGDPLPTGGVPDGADDPLLRPAGPHHIPDGDAPDAQLV